MRFSLKRFFRTALVLSFITGWLPLFAQVTTISLQIPTDSSGYPGDVIRMPVMLNTNVDTENMLAFKLEFRHGAELTPIGISKAGTLTDSWDVLFSRPSSSTFAVTAAGVNALSGTGELFYVDFELGNVNYDLNSSVYLNTSANNYFNEGGYTVESNSGYITVMVIPTLSVWVNDTDLTKGQTTTINVSGGTPPYTYSVTNTSVGSITDDNMLRADQHGTVRVHVEDANGVEGNSSEVTVYGYELSFSAGDNLFAEDTTYIEVTTTDLQGLGILSGSFDVGFSNVEILDTEVSGTLLENAEFESSYINGTTVRYAFAGSSALGSGETLVRLKVKIIASVSSGYIYFNARNITFNEDLEGNYMDQSFPFQGMPVPVISGNPGEIISGESYQFSVSGGTAPYTWSVSDPQVASISETGSLTVLKGGSLKVSATDSFGQSTTTPTFSLLDGEINLPEAVTPGERLYDFPVYITELPEGREAFAYSFTVQLTSADATFVEAVKAGTLSESFSITTNNTDVNNIRIAGAGQSGITGPGILCYLRLQLNADFTLNETTYLYLTNVLFNEGSPSLRVSNGSIRISTMPPTASNVSAELNEDEEYFFDASLFNYAQEDNLAFQSIRIESLPSKGTLYYFGSPVSAGATIAVANFASFHYLPGTDENGIDYDSFYFKVYDGTNYSNDAYAYSFTVNPVNDPPLFTLSETTIERDQDFETAIVITPTLFVPADETSENVVFSLSPSDVAFANVSIDVQTGVVTISSVSNLYGEQDFTVTANDGQAGNNLHEESFTLRINKVNAAPVIANQIFSIPENAYLTQTVDTVVATDPNGDAVSFSITGGNVNNTFSIESGTGIVKLVNTVDFETLSTYALTISASDGTASTSAAVTVSIIDIDETNAPTIPNQGFSLEENAEQGATVGNIFATDPNGDALTYTISAGNALDAFLLNSNTGELTVNNPEAFDFETMPSFVLSVIVSDGTLTASAAITVTVLDVFENIPPVIEDQTFHVNENSDIDTFVGEVIATDANGEFLTYELIDGNAGNVFAIDANSGNLYVANPTKLDYETQGTFSLTVQVLDQLTSDVAAITIHVNDLDETNAPVIADQTFSITENSSFGTVVGTMTATDPNGDALSFEIISGNSGDAFSINALGEISVNNSLALDFETIQGFILIIAVSDNIHDAFAVATISVNDVQEIVGPQLIQELADVSIDEDDAEQIIVSDLNVNFDDADTEVLTFSATSSSSGVTVSVQNNQLRAIPSADFFGTSTITVTASDGANEATGSFVLTVSSINDAPSFTIDRSLVEVQQNFSGAQSIIADPGVVPLNEQSQTVVYSLSPATVSFANVSINPTTGQVSITSIPGGFGTQTFTITANDGQGQNATFSREFTLRVLMITDAEQNLSETLKIYPNPARNHVAFDFPYKNYEVEFYDIKGVRRMSWAGSRHGVAQVDISALAAGLYILKIKSGSIAQYKKLRVE